MPEGNDDLGSRGMLGTADTSARPSIAAAWVKNNTLAAGISGIASLAIYGVRQATGVADAEAGSLAPLALLFGVAIILSAFAGIAYGVLTGAVLQRILPMLPVKAWIAMNTAMAVAAGVLSEIGLLLLSGTPASDDTSIAETLLVGVIMGSVLGGAIGALQAVVLRKVSLGTSAWVTWSVVAFILAVILVAVSGKLWETGGGFAGELANQVVAFLGYVIVSVVMLPALRRLRDPLLSAAGPHFS
jgi:hypothetical protein